MVRRGFTIVDNSKLLTVLSKDEPGKNYYVGCKGSMRVGANYETSVPVQPNLKAALFSESFETCPEDINALIKKHKGI